MRIKILLSYDGLWFYGWAKQPNLPTVQGILEEALRIIIRKSVLLIVAGRTDTGVHARQQVAHFDVDEKDWLKLTSMHENNSKAFIYRINSLIQILILKKTGTKLSKNAIYVLSLDVVNKSFNARFSAIWRRYSYTINDSMNLNPLERFYTLHYRKKLDEESMNEASKLLLGKNDFSSFCKHRKNATTIRTLYSMYWKRNKDRLIMEIKADAFCHHMVRSLVGAILMVGDGRRNPEWIYKKLLTRTRSAESNTAPGHALVLEEIGYPSEDLWSKRNKLTKSKR